MGLRGEVGRVIGNGLITGGIDLSGGRVASSIDNDPPPMPGGPIADDEMNVQIENSRWYADLGLWVEGFYQIDGGRLGLRPGVRVDRFGFTDQWTFDPRLTVTHQLPHVTLKESVGLYHQPPVAADLDPGYGNPDLEVSRSLQASVGAETELPGGVTVGVTNFYEQLYDQPVDVVSSASPSSNGPLQGGAASAISESLSEQFGTYSYRENRGRGQNYGVEVLTQRRGDRFFGWLAYTYARSFRSDDPRQTLLPRRYVLDQPHLVTALASVKLPDGWQTAARVRFASGNPFTPVVGSYYDAEEMEYRPIDGPTLSERLPAFFQLDLRVDRTWRRSWGVMSLYLDVQNVTNRRNVEGVEYDDDYQSYEYTRGLPIFPSIGVEYRQ
jgi:hypothetical protein